MKICAKAVIFSDSLDCLPFLWDNSMRLPETAGP